MTQKDKETTSRRGFLKLATTTAPIAAVAVASSGQVAEAAEPDLQETRLQDTAHTRAYLNSARF